MHRANAEREEAERECRTGVNNKACPAHPQSPSHEYVGQTQPRYPLMSENIEENVMPSPGLPTWV